MLYKNNVIPKAKIVVVNVITHATSITLRNDYQFLFKKQSFNQALIRAEVDVDTKFDLTKLKMNADVNTFLNNFNTMNSEQIMISIRTLYEKYGKHKPNIGKIDDNTNTRTYLFYTNILASSSGFSTLGICSLDTTTGAWGNSYIIYSTGLSSKHTVTHEAGHSFSLEHSFQPGATKHEFYQGTTDKDYSQQDDATAGFYHEDKMNCYFKWQWDIMRTDRSLINTY